MCVGIVSSAQGLWDQISSNESNVSGSEDKERKTRKIHQIPLDKVGSGYQSLDTADLACQLYSTPLLTMHIIYRGPI